MQCSVGSRARNNYGPMPLLIVVHEPAEMSELAYYVLLLEEASVMPAKRHWQLTGANVFITA